MDRSNSLSKRDQTAIIKKCTDLIPQNLCTPAEMFFTASNLLDWCCGKGTLSCDRCSFDLVVLVTSSDLAECWKSLGPQPGFQKARRGSGPDHTGTSGLSGRGTASIGARFSPPSCPHHCLPSPDSWVVVLHQSHQSFLQSPVMHLSDNYSVANWS